MPASLFLIGLKKAGYTQLTHEGGSNGIVATIWAGVFPLKINAR